jgi:hypothetical protein
MNGRSAENAQDSPQEEGPCADKKAPATSPETAFQKDLRNRPDLMKGI